MEQTRVADHATQLAELRDQVRTLDARVGELGRHL
jgi:ubiquinone biosynthesis protein UbiJ